MSKMGLSPSLEAKLTIQPSVLQVVSAKLTAMTSLELQQHLIQEVEENPILDIEVEDSERTEPVAKESDFPQLLEDRTGDATLPIFPTAVEEEEDEAVEPEAPPIGFWERLEIQLVTNFKKGTVEFKIAEKIINSLNGLGILYGTSTESIATELGVSQNLVEKVRRFILMEFDPPGVAALDLRELYLVQLQRRKLTDTLIYKIVSDDELWEQVRKVGLQNALRAIANSEEDVEENLNIFSSLYTAPSKTYERHAAYVYPDVIFKEVDGLIVVEFPKGLYPKIRLNRRYMELLKDKNIPKEAKSFLKKHLLKARVLLEALEQRQSNIRKVAEYIALKQEDFLLGRTKYLDPVTQKDAAESLGMTVSTFNRVVNGKYADTPVGIFELKFFFSRGLSLSDGVKVTPDEVKNYIKMLLEKEDPSSPLSDAKIAEILKEKYGLEIARRTVAKYRTEIGIPKASVRKRLKLSN